MISKKTDIVINVELDENKIMENIIDYKQKYQSWRKGKSKGAKDMENIRKRCVYELHQQCLLKI